MNLRLTLFFAAYATVQAASISGSVADLSGAIVSDAIVTLHKTTGSFVLTASSDRNGRFAFPQVSAGEYLLEASAPGLTLNPVQTLQLAESTEKQVTLQLSLSSLRTLVSVTSSGSPQTIDQVSKALDVVETADAEKRGLFSVTDALRFVPGLRISTRGGPGSFTTIQTRGLRATDTAVLVDGFPFRDATSIQDEASAYLGELFLVDSSRIEVLRGSGSSLYGSNAISGTVNIITGVGGHPLHGDVDLQGGGLGLFRGVAHLADSARDNRFYYSAGISHLDVTEGVQNAGAARDWSGQGSAGFALRPNIRLYASLFANTGFLQLTDSPSPTSAAPTSGIVAALPNNTFLPSLPDPDFGRYARFVHSLVRFEHEVNRNFSYRIGYGLADTSRNTTNGPGGPQNLYTYQPSYNTSDRAEGHVDTLQARANYSIGLWQTFTGGYEFQREHYSDVAAALLSRTSTVATQRTNAVFAQDEIRLLQGRLQVLLSGRYTRASLEQPSFLGGSSPYTVTVLPSPPRAYTGDAALSYFFPKTSTKVRAHFGNSFRLPSIYERFGGYFYGGVYYALGDPKLAPERAVSGDFGFDQYLLHERLKLSGGYFYSHLQSVIGYVSSLPGVVDVYGRYSGYYNTRGAVSRGVETSADIRPTRKTSILGSYTYTKAQDRASQYYTGTAVSPLQIPRIMPHLFTLVGTAQLTKRIDAALDFAAGSNYLYPLYGYDSSFNYRAFAYRFKGPRQLGVSAAYTLPLGDRTSARFYVRVTNVLNQGFYEDGFTTPGRWAVAGIRFAF